MATETTKKKVKKTAKRAASKSAAATAKKKATVVRDQAKATSKTTTSVKAAAQAAAVQSPEVRSPAETFKKWSLWLGIVYLLQGLAIILLGSSASTPVTTQYLSTDTLATDANGHQVLASAARHVADVRLAWVVAIVLAILAAVHLVLAYASRQWHETRLRRGVNELRALGLGLGGGAMAATIGLLGGISDIATLTLLFAATAVGCALGLAAETVVANNGGKMSRFSHLMCALAITGVVLPWLVFAGQMVSAAMFGGHIPGYLYGIYASMFVLFVVGMWVTHLRIVRKGEWTDAAYTERAYLALMFVSATAFAWQVFAGVLHS